MKKLLSHLKSAPSNLSRCREREREREREKEREREREYCVKKDFEFGLKMSSLGSFRADFG